tara:strand:+ start:24621 stop:25163 length:543 start_codon:yes stop_codon:yes gene_type:complete
MKLKWIIILLLVLALGWYLLSPLFNIVEVDEVSPLDTVEAEVGSIEAIPSEMQEAFDKEMEKMKDKVMAMDDVTPEKKGLLSEGEFMPKAHDVEGRALLIENNGATTLRFENFETTNGPNLHIWLSADLQGKDYLDLGKIKATKGNVNYDVPSDADLDKYNKVLVWCVPFKVLFSYAELA